MPSQALEEDAETIVEIMSLRAYARAKVAVEQSQEESDATEWQKAIVFDVVGLIAQRR